MKRILITLVLSLLLVILAGGSVLALTGSIKNTKHDLSSGSTAATKSSEEDEICVFCHTPHNARVNVPLWNRTTSQDGTSFTLYTSSTINGVSDSLTEDSSNISVLCLSCHDGTVSLGSIVNNYPDDPMARGEDPAMTGNVDPGTGKLTGAYTKLDTNLSNDHPVAITYVYSATPGAPGSDMVDPASGDFQPCQLFNNKVECASCHAVHGGTGAEPFLRASNAGSGLCLKCHRK